MYFFVELYHFNLKECKTMTPFRVKEETAISLSSKVLKDLDDELLEMTSMEATQGSKIVSFYGHFR